ncbi:hypothetical protein RND71_005999 [Anisodus tanguticus]|uniref:Uncharacterized protein n=1 Tax=Anisodus tanguticus TaxID=243964 RepID=A0AAE1VN76_9SOLA|nr:hypothetical protein RND71_005999 [Anisodus tanguticus]
MKSIVNLFSVEGTNQYRFSTNPNTKSSNLGERADRKNTESFWSNRKQKVKIVLYGDCGT